MENKPSYKSKTLWIALINALIAFFPGAQHVITEYPTEYAIFLSLVFSLLRAVTKGKVEIN